MSSSRLPLHVFSTFGESDSKKVPVPEISFGDMFDMVADAFPEKEALVDDAGRFTYQQIRQKSDRLAVGLNNLGIAPMDRVLLQLPNWHEFIVAYFALQKIGAIPVILIARYRQYEINHLAKSSEAVAWIVAEKFRRTDYLPIIEDVRRQHPKLAHIIVCRSTTDHGHIRLEDIFKNTVVDQDTKQRLADLKPHPLKTAHMGPTGGTTGVPKIASHTHRSYLCRVGYSAKASELTSKTICLVVLPAAHDLPFANGILATLIAGGKLVLSNHTDPASICKLIEEEKINTVIWVPTLTQRILNSDAVKESDVSSLELIYCGGGASSPEMIQGAMDTFNCTYLCGYGGTEGMLVTTRRGDDIKTLCQTIGKPVCPLDHYKIVDKNGRTQPANTTGHLVVKGPSIFNGYHNMAEENSAAFTDQGYFRTGDLAAIDEFGYIRLTGREKDTIKRGGESIFASEIETLINDHQDVDIVAVIGVPDPEMGERVCAVIQQKTGADLSLGQLVGYLKDRGASVLQLPEFVEFIDEIPLTAAGKVNKKKLKKIILEKF